MAKEWSVTTERLESSANVIEEKTGTYHTEWEKLYTELQNLRSAKWKGIASDTFNDRLEGYRNDFKEMEDVLKQYAEFLKTAAKNYKTVEEELKNAASNLSVGK